MNQKQLANVLIKVLGVSFCIHGFPSVVVGIVAGLLSLVRAMHDGNQTNMHGLNTFWFSSLSYLVSCVVEFGIGIFLIIRTSWLTDKLFKNEPC